MAIENIMKSLHGINGINAMDQMIETMKARDYIVRAVKRYRIADPDYGEEQFYFQFLIEFNDNEQWILHHTTSIRDRITEQQWHSEHIKRLNAYVKKAYVVVPDGMLPREKAIAENYNNKIMSGSIYSALDGVLTFEAMNGLIEDKAASLLKDGKAKALLGLDFEKKLELSLKNRENLVRWKRDTSTSVGYFYSLYADVMKALDVHPNEVDFVWATSEIKKLPSGGSPKTDVLATVVLGDGTKKSYTFSCKRSLAKRVSVHEYSADAFSKVLNPDDSELKDLLVEFQNAGGIRNMESGSAEALEKKLSAYKDKLNKWVLAGVGGEGEPEIQWATHIISLNPITNQYTIRTIDEYIDECEKKGIKGQFGTLFQWTYPSGGLGKRIQLKMMV